MEADLSFTDYQELFTGNNVDGRRKLALEQAHEIRKFEIQLYWTRATYFWTFIGVSLAAFGAVQTLKDPAKTDLSIFVCCFGFLLSFAWYCANRGSKYWQENWENHVDLLEDSVTGPLYKVVIRRARRKNWARRLRSRVTGPHPYSVSKINQIISLYVTGLWVFLCWYSLPPFVQSAPINGDYVFVISFTCAAAIGIMTAGRTTTIDYEIVARQRRTILTKDTAVGESLETGVG